MGMHAWHGWMPGGGFVWLDCSLTGWNERINMRLGAFLTTAVADDIVISGGSLSVSLANLARKETPMEIKLKLAL